MILTAILSVTTTLAELASVYENVQGLAAEFVVDNSIFPSFNPRTVFSIVPIRIGVWCKRRFFKLAKLNGQDFK